jgi:hypothetical protein
MLLPPPRPMPDERPDARALAPREDDIVILPAPGQPPVRVRPPASTLVERLRQMQMQGWS